MRELQYATQECYPPARACKDLQRRKMGSYHTAAHQLQLAWARPMIPSVPYFYRSGKQWRYTLAD
jgi:hypothetical protein